MHNKHVICLKKQDEAELDENIKIVWSKILIQQFKHQAHWLLLNQNKTETLNRNQWFSIT